MKYSFFYLGVLSLSTVALNSGCNTPSQKVENAEANVAEAEADLAKAQEDYLKDVEAFKKQTAERTELNRQSIAEFNARVSKDKSKLKEEYLKNLAELEKKNSDMKKKLDEYKADGKANWESFKTEFNRDMDQLGIALKNLTTDNK